MVQDLRKNRALESLGLLEARPGQGTSLAARRENRRSYAFGGPLRAWEHQHKLFEVRLLALRTFGARIEQRESVPRGAALVIVMLLMVVLQLAGMTFLTISATESQIALNEQGSAAAHVLAEAGIHKALALLNVDPNYAGETSTALGGGTFSIRVTTVAACTATSARKIVATGSVPVRGGNAQVQLEVVLDRVSYPYRWAAFAAVPNQIIGWLWDPMAQDWWDRTNSELLLRDHTLVDSFDSGVGPYDPTTNSGLHGDVGANGDVEIDYHSTINGNVQAGDDIFNESAVTVTGTQTRGLSRRSTDPGAPFPTVTPSVIPTGALTVPAGGTVTLSAGTYFYTNISMGNNATLLTTGGVRHDLCDRAAGAGDRPAGEPGEQRDYGGASRDPIADHRQERLVARHPERRVAEGLSHVGHPGRLPPLRQPLWREHRHLSELQFPGLWLDHRTDDPCTK